MPGPCSDFRDSSILLLRKFPTWSENPFIPKQRQKRFDLLPFAHIPETRLQLVSHSNMNNQQGHLLSLPLLALMTLQGTQQQTLSLNRRGLLSAHSLAFRELPQL